MQQSRIQDHIAIDNPKINQLNFKYKDLKAEKDNFKQIISNTKSVLIEHQKYCRYCTKRYGQEKNTGI